MTEKDIIITRDEGDWVFGRIGEMYFEVKRTEQPTRFGINEGRIIKLWMIRHVTYGLVASYDRGWDRLPHYDNEIEATQAIIDRFS